LEQTIITLSNNVDSEKLNYLRTIDVRLIRPTHFSCSYLERLNQTTNFPQ